MIKIVPYKKYVYEPIDVSKEIIFYSEIYDELKVVAFIKGILWLDEDTPTVSNNFVTDCIMDKTWQIIGEL